METDSKKKRPVTVWIVQIIIAFLWIGSVGVGLYSIGSISASAVDSSGPLIALLSAYSLVVVLLSLAFWGLQQRRSYGRWLGLAFVALLSFSSWYHHPNPFRIEQEVDTGGPIRKLMYENREEMAGAMLARLAIHAALIMLMARLAFAKKTKEFFEEDKAAATSRGPLHLE